MGPQEGLLLGTFPFLQLSHRCTPVVTELTFCVTHFGPDHNITSELRRLTSSQSPLIVTHPDLAVRRTSPPPASTFWQSEQDLLSLFRVHNLFVPSPEPVQTLSSF